MKEQRENSRPHSAQSRRKSPPQPHARRTEAAEGDELERLRAALHDGLGQLLTSISFLASGLRQKLAARKLPEETQAAEILTLAGRAISETQALVRDHDHDASEMRL